MSKELDKKDLERASWEGIQGADTEIFIDENIAFFLTKVKAAFDSNHSYFGFADAFCAVIAKASEDELIKVGVEPSIAKNEAGQEKLISGFRPLFKVFLGDKKWERFEHESLKRHLKNDLENGGTPG